MLWGTAEDLRPFVRFSACDFGYGGLRAGRADFMFSNAGYLYMDYSARLKSKTAAQVQPQCRMS